MLTGIYTFLIRIENFAIIKILNFYRTKPPCQGEEPTPKCKKVCETTYKTPFKADLHFGAKAYSVKSTVEAIATEIMTNGPVEGI